MSLISNWTVKSYTTIEIGLQFDSDNCTVMHSVHISHISDSECDADLLCICHVNSLTRVSVGVSGHILKLCHMYRCLEAIFHRMSRHLHTYSTAAGSSNLFCPMICMHSENFLNVDYLKDRANSVTFIDGFHSILSLWQLEGVTSPCCLLIASHDPFICPPVSMVKDTMESIF